MDDENSNNLLDAEFTDELEELASKFHVDHLNLQKIIAFMNVSKTNKFSADSLAEY